MYNHVHVYVDIHIIVYQFNYMYMVCMHDLCCKVEVSTTFCLDTMLIHVFLVFL